MPLALPQTVRETLAQGEPITESDIRALCDIIDHLWQQVRNSRPVTTPEAKRAYMRRYMAAWRAKKKAASALAATGGATSH